MSSDKPQGAASPNDETTAMPPGDRPGSTLHSYVGGWQPPTVAQMQAMLPQYQFIEMLGAGGMGAVYKAMQVSLDRLVAIKILPPGLEDGSGLNFAERFKQEAKTMAKMNHPCIVHVHDFGQTAGGQLYFVMEFIEGTDVQKMIRANKRLKPDDALAITSHVCDALEYAHARGVIHRDIKPANVLISAEGVVKIADFGLAKAAGSGNGTSIALTSANVAMGTPQFMAPEAMYADVKVDGRADLYAVGVMLHNMLTGEIPTGRFKLPSKKVGCDPRFDEIVKKAMEEDREERYQTATEIRKDLDTILSTPIMAEGDEAIPVVPPLELMHGQKMRAVTDSVIATVPPDMRKQESAKIPPQQAKAASAKIQAQQAKAASAKIPPAQNVAPEKKAVPPKKEITPAASPGLGKIMGIVAAVVAVIFGVVYIFSGHSEKTSTTTSPSAGAATIAAGAVVPKPATNQVANETKPELPPKIVTTSPPVASPPKSTAKPPVTAVGNPVVGPVRFSPSTEPWVDALADPDRLILGRGGMRTADGLKVFADGSRLPQLAGPDCAVRLIVAPTMSKTPKIQLREQGNANYMVRVGSDYITVSRYLKGQTLTNIAQFSIGRRLMEIGTYEVEARIVGSKITVAFDGDVIGSVEDSTFKTGGASFGADGFTAVLLSGVQYLDLSAPAKKSDAGILPAQPVAQSGQVASVATSPAALTGIDLLASVDVERDAISGDWSRKGADLLQSRQIDTSLLEFTNAVPDEYDFEIEFTPMDNISCVNQILTANGHNFSWKVGLDTQAKDFPCLFDWPGGKLPADASRASASLGKWLEKGKRHRSTVEVRKGSVRGLLDGVELVKWSGDFNLLKLRDASPFRDPRHLGIGSYRRSVVFHRATLRPAGSAAVGLPSSASASSATPATATKDSPFVNSLGMKFVPVPIIGGPSGGKRVLFSIWDTRVQDYEKKGLPRSQKIEQGPTHPVVQVQYYDAKSFCNWLTELERNAGKLGANERYRLPTDHEWSCAAGIGEREDPAKLADEKNGKIPDEYPWGTQWPPPKGAGNFVGDERGDGKTVSAGYNDGFVNTSPVGSFAPNRFGLYDMGGNVLQWCDGTVSGTDGRKLVLLRGSSWETGSADDLLSSRRSKKPPNSSTDSIGFRCVLAPDDAAQGESSAVEKK